MNKITILWNFTFEMLDDGQYTGPTYIFMYILRTYIW